MICRIRRVLERLWSDGLKGHLLDPEGRCVHCAYAAKRRRNGEGR